MHNSNYMFVKYDKDFPVRLSLQSGRKNLVIPHYHEAAEILKVSCGEVSVKVGNDFLNCYKGDIIVFYPKTLHQVCAVSEDAEIISITYKTEATPFVGAFLPIVGGFFIFKEDHPEYLKICEVFDRAVKLFSTRDSTFEIEMTACLLQFTAAFVRVGIVTAETEKADKSRLAPAFRYIENNLASAVKIADLERLLNLSKEHIIRLFKAETGKTPNEYIIDYKIKTAMEMLKGNCTITEISESLGFSNPSHLSKVFKARVNMTPREYKKNLN